MISERGMFLRFALVGAAAFAFDAALTTALIAVGAPPPIARAIALFVSMNATFLANGIVTFGGFARGAALIRQWAAYMLANALGAGVNYGVFLLVVGHAQPILAVAAGSIAGLVVNYTGSRWLAFRRAL